MQKKDEPDLLRPSRRTLKVWATGVRPTKQQNRVRETIGPAHNDPIEKIQTLRNCSKSLFPPPARFSFAIWHLPFERKQRKRMKERRWESARERDTETGNGRINSKEKNWHSDDDRRERDRDPWWIRWFNLLTMPLTTDRRTVMRILRTIEWTSRPSWTLFAQR